MQNGPEILRRCKVEKCLATYILEIAHHIIDGDLVGHNMLLDGSTDGRKDTWAESICIVPSLPCDWWIIKLVNNFKIPWCWLDTCVGWLRLGKYRLCITLKKVWTLRSSNVHTSKVAVEVMAARNNPFSICLGWIYETFILLNLSRNFIANCSRNISCTFLLRKIVFEETCHSYTHLYCIHI